MGPFFGLAGRKLTPEQGLSTRGTVRAPAEAAHAEKVALEYADAITDHRGVDDDHRAEVPADLPSVLAIVTSQSAGRAAQ